MAIAERWKGAKPTGLSTDEAVREAVSLMSADPRILAVYLFGSRAREGAPGNSDIDIAFHARRDFEWEDYYRLHGALTVILKSDMLDLVWLEAADAIMCFEVIKTGKPIYCSDAEMLNEFELYVKKRFWDYSAYLRKRNAMAQG